MMSLPRRNPGKWFRTFLIPLSLATVAAQIPAFPGAEGFGAHATGGRGGDVYHVTNLNSSGAGSLRYGVENAPSSGRTIVFAVSGHIPISNNSDTGNKTVRIVKNKITIAGQTAPGDGIGLKDGRILVTGKNTILRHFRIRHGKNGGAGDCLNIQASGTGTMMDHLSMQFGTDEIISMYESTPVDDLTLQSSIVAWGLESHSKGGLWSVQDTSCIDSLWAHNTDRNPKAQPWGLLEWVNNVTLDYGAGFLMGDTSTPAPFKANVVGSYFIHSRYGNSSLALESARIDRNGQPNFSLWLDNCLHDSAIENYPASKSGVLNGTNKGYSIAEGSAYNPSNTYTEGQYVYAKATAPHPGSSGNVAITVDSPLTALKKVVSDAGALRLDAAYSGPIRDEVDALVIDDVLNQRNRQINGEYNLPVSNSGFGTLNSAPAPVDTDLDGMPDRWEAALGFNPLAANHNTVFANNGSVITASTFFPANTPAGYTHLEEYLHFLSVPHVTVGKNTASAPTSFSADLRRYTSGFSNAPVFGVASISGGTIQQFAANGTTPSATGPIVKFTPTQDSIGRAGFSFTVTDAEGSTWTRQFAILVSPGGTGAPPSAGVRINVDFDKGSTYSGTAAAPDTGTTWNTFPTPAATSHTLSNVTGSDGSATPCDVTVTAGSNFKSWSEGTLGNPNPSALMSDYLYGNTYTVTVSDLPAGEYHLYVYAHGDAATQGSTVTVDAANGGGSATAGTTGTQYRNLFTSGAEGYSYLKFQPVVGASGTLVFTASSYLNGFQLLTEPVQNLFVNMTTAAGNTGALQSIPAMAGWGYSAAAPVPGTRWNVFNETNFNAYQTLAVGQVWTMTSNVPLVSADGTLNGARMTVAYHAATDALTSDRLTTNTGVATGQPGGVMDQLMRNFWDRGGNGNFQRFSFTGLVPDKPYLLYIYGAAGGNTGSWNARVDLDLDGTVDILTTDPSSASDPNSDALFTYDGTGGFHLGPPGQVWNKGIVTANASGTAVFDSRGHLSGFQLITYQSPQISSQPEGQTINPGEQASFSVVAEAYPAPSFQWCKNGSPIPNATGTTYTIATAGEGDAGDYTVMVSNDGTSVTSAAASLAFHVPAYDAYFTGYGLDPSGDGAPDEDADFDGLKNIVEFFLGMNPTGTGDPDKLPTLSRTTSGPAGVVFEIHRLKGAADIPFTVEFSTDPSGEWTPAVHGEAEVTIETESLDENHDRIVVTIPTNEPRLFARLKL